MQKYRVNLVVDRDYGSRLRELPAGEPAWIIDSPTNHPIIQELWQDPDRQDSLTGITSFADDTRHSSENVAQELFDTIWDHHGEYSHDPPMAAIRIIGAPKAKGIIDYFADCGFSRVDGEDGDYEIGR